jgi:hypothetical protein
LAAGKAAIHSVTSTRPTTYPLVPVHSWASKCGVRKAAVQRATSKARFWPRQKPVTEVATARMWREGARASQPGSTTVKLRICAETYTRLRSTRSSFQSRADAVELVCGAASECAAACARHWSHRYCIGAMRPRPAQPGARCIYLRGSRQAGHLCAGSLPPRSRPVARAAGNQTPCVSPW